MSKVVGVVADWHNGAEEHAKKVSEFCDIEVIVVPGFDHEPEVLNKAIYAAGDVDYVWFIAVDNQIIYEDTARVLATFLDRHPQVGVVCPNREGEPRGFRQPFSWYLADNTCTMYRKSVGAKFDTDFFFTGWNDLDFGETVRHLGYQIVVYGLISVNKEFTAYGSWSNFRKAYNARNRLLLEAKWYWIGIEDWHGVDYYNDKQAKEGQRIPTIFELAWWSEEKLERFADSVDMEHPQIYIKDGKEPGNTKWTINNI